LNDTLSAADGGGDDEPWSTSSRADSVFDQILGIVVGEAQSRHENARILCGEFERDRILLRPHFVRIHDEVRQPLVIAAGGDVAQVGTGAIADADRVARRAHLLVQDLPRFIADPVVRVGGAALRLARLVAPFLIHAAHIHHEAVDVAEHRVPPPHAECVVAEHDLLAVLAQNGAAVAQRGVDRPHVLRLSGQEQPARPDVKPVGIFLELFRRIALRIDAERHEEDIAPDRVAQPVLHLRQPRSREAANVRAVRVDEIDHHDLALDHVVIESQRFAVLSDHRQVRHIALAPPPGFGVDRCVSQKLNGDKRRNTCHRSNRGQVDSWHCILPKLAV